MVKNFLKKAVLLSSVFASLSLIISCEEDFRDVGSSVINNTKFDTETIDLDIEISQKNIEATRGDNIELGNHGAYLLGVYNKKGVKSANYSFTSQLGLGLLSELKLVKNTYGADTTVVSTIDEVVLRIPIPATNTRVTGDDKPSFRLDTILGDITKPFMIDVFESSTYLNRLNPLNPSKGNKYETNSVYQQNGAKLNMDSNFTFENAQNDTVFYFNRHLSTGAMYQDSVKIDNGSITAVPFKTIKLDKAKFKTMFLDQYGTGSFVNQTAFNNYFKGLIIEATGTEGSVAALNFSTAALIPSVEIYFTNTVLKAATVIDTITRVNSFKLSGGITNSINTTAPVNVISNTVTIQGTSGSAAELEILTPMKLNELRQQNLLINEASITLYLNTNTAVIDTTNVPSRLFLFKQGISKTGGIFQSQITDVMTEGPEAVGGYLFKKDSKPKGYTFKITDYISNLLSGKSTYNPPLKIKVFNARDIPANVNDTLVTNYSWNPRSVSLLDNNLINGGDRAILKISYSKKK